MRSSEIPSAAEWFAISLRWLTLLGLVFSLSLEGRLLAAPNLLLVGLAGWNIFLSLLAGFGRRLPLHGPIGLGADLLFAGGYLALAGGFTTPAFWIIFLPVLTGSIYFGLRGALIMALLDIAVQAAVLLGLPSADGDLRVLGGSVLSTLLVAIGFGLLGGRFMRSIRRSYEAQQEIWGRQSRLVNERIRAIYNLTSTLMATLNYQRVLESVLDLSMTAIGTDAGADDRLICAVMLFSKSETLEVGSSRRLTPADLRVVLRGQTGVVGQAIEQNDPILLTDVRSDPELTRFVSFQKCKEVYCFPLRTGFNAYGVLLFGHAESGFFTTDRREMLDILGSQAMVAIQNARLYQDVVDERERMIEVQEEARKKLARDLHDGPTQSVSAIAMRVSMAHRILEKNPQAAGEELARIEELARRTTKEIRHMLFTLRPLVLESQGLVAALKSMAEKMKETYAQNVLVALDENILKGLEMGKQSVIFYLVEEAVTNARKHARADHIWVSLRPIEMEIALLEIRDDGAGFDVASVTRAYDQRGSLGMVNLRERAELVNGILDIQSAPGKGTRVQVYVPLTEEAADRLHRAAGKRQ